MTAPRRPVQKSVKRLLDVVAAVVVLLVCLPLLLVLALVVKLTSPGPVLFVQERAGLGGRPFRMLKFRTMRVRRPEEQALVWTAADEAAVTGPGRFLRDFGLDELPQVVNILRGDMSVVGPRPPLPAQAQRYTPAQRRMFEMRPGVLSLAAIRGRRSITPEERIACHVEYVDRWSLWLDLTILVRGAVVVFLRRDTHETPPLEGPGAAGGSASSAAGA